MLKKYSHIKDTRRGEDPEGAYTVLSFTKTELPQHSELDMDRALGIIKSGKVIVNTGPGKKKC